MLTRPDMGDQYSFIEQLLNILPFSCPSMHGPELYLLYSMIIFFPNTFYNIITKTRVAHEN